MVFVPLKGALAGPTCSGHHILLSHMTKTQLGISRQWGCTDCALLGHLLPCTVNATANFKQMKHIKLSFIHCIHQMKLKSSFDSCAGLCLKWIYRLDFLHIESNHELKHECIIASCMIFLLLKICNRWVKQSKLALKCWPFVFSFSYEEFITFFNWWSNNVNIHTGVETGDK